MPVGTLVLFLKTSSTTRRWCGFSIDHDQSHGLLRLDSIHSASESPPVRHGLMGRQSHPRIATGTLTWGFMWRWVR